MQKQAALVFSHGGGSENDFYFSAASTLQCKTGGRGRERRAVDAYQDFHFVRVEIFYSDRHTLGGAKFDRTKVHFGRVDLQPLGVGVGNQDGPQRCETE